MQRYSAEQKIETVAIIPARGGSKGIPRKNLIPLGGKPLIAYTLDVALQSETIDRVVVSTDDEEIAMVACDMGAEVPFFRPKELAHDKADLTEVVNDSIEKLMDRGYACDVVAIMLPTHPFRNVRLVDGLVRLLLQGHSVVKTVRRILLKENRFFSMSQNGKLLPMKIGSSENDIYYRDYGLFTAYNRTPIPPVNGLYLHVVENPISLIDIDDYSDLRHAETIIKNNMFDFIRK
jgi:N-acylneuraminate cytidylyltransferase